MATIYYIRERSTQGNISSSREVSVADLISLYGPETARYEYLPDLDVPDIGTSQAPAASGSEPALVFVKVDGHEAGQEPFTGAGLYRIRNVDS